MTNHFNSASLDSIKALRPLVKRHIPTMLTSPKAHQVLALVTKIGTVKSKDTHDFDFPMVGTSVAIEDNQVWDTTPPT